MTNCRMINGEKMLKKGLIEKIDDHSFTIHFVDQRKGRLPGVDRRSKISNYNTKDDSTCEVKIQTNTGAKTIFMTIRIKYPLTVVDEKLMEHHKMDFIEFYNEILY